MARALNRVGTVDMTSGEPVITDAHQHAWDPSRLSYPWLAGIPELNQPRLPVQAATPGVNRVIFVEADAADGVAEAEWVQGLAGEWPELVGIVAHAPVEKPELPAVLDRLGQLPLFRGVRRLLQDEPIGFMSSTGFRRGLQTLSERGIPFDACVRHHQLRELRQALEHADGCTIVLDHLGKPPLKHGLESREGAAWTEGILALAELPTVFVKLSGLAPEADVSKPFADQARPFLEVALEAFGPEHSMSGSDWPVSAVTPHRLANIEWFNLIASLVESAADKQVVLSGTAERVYVR